MGLFSRMNICCRAANPARAVRDCILLFLFSSVLLSSVLFSQMSVQKQSFPFEISSRSTPAEKSTANDVRLTFTPLFELQNKPDGSLSALSVVNSSILTRVPPDHCILIGKDSSRDTLWLENSRALCLTSSVCLRHKIERLFYTIGARRTSCALSQSTASARSANVSFRFEQELGGCANFRRNKVVCAYGTGYILNKASCPEEHTLQDTEQLTRHSSSSRWLEELTVIVPEYPYQRNIFHYSTSLNYVAFVAAHLQELLAEWRRTAAEQGQILLLDNRRQPAVVNFVFRGKHDKNMWQRGLFQATFEELIPKYGIQPRVHFLGALDEDGVTCFRNAVQMGKFRDVFAWPFSNDSAVDVDGRSVSVQAVEMREAAYHASGVAKLELGGMGDAKSERKILRVPPLVVRYSRRMGSTDLEEAVGNNVKRESIERVFTTEDERWFAGMLREEVSARGVELREEMTRNVESFGEQVAGMAGVGLVVGIHGANLVNAMFMPPFGGLVEIFPYEAKSRCYLAGMNSGLAYWTFRASESAGGFRCTEKGFRCQLQYRNQNVYLGDGEDRRKVRLLVREAVQYLKDVHEKFRDGVPVRLDKHSGRYLIDESV